MKPREILALAGGSCILLIAVPAVMIMIAALFPLGFLPAARVGLTIGALCSGCGLFFVIWANLELWRKGHGGAAVVGPVKLMRESTALVTSGPYALCRNPMHLGLILFYLGLSCAINSLWSLAVPLSTGLFAYVFAVYIDEPRLKRDFTQAYAAWSAMTPRFVPRLKRP